MAKVKISKEDIGRWVPVKWDDIGRVDCLLVDIHPDYKDDLKVFQPHSGLHRIDRDQIIEKRGYQNAA